MQTTTPVLVCGYGIPANILKDQNYEIYLRTVFNTLFDACVQTGVWDRLIIFSGGKTDMRKPYRRAEADEMKRAFQNLMQRPVVKKQVKHWKLVSEKKSLSTLDNFLYTKQLLEGRSAAAVPILVFCEKTRVTRVGAIAKKLFPHATILPIDFDQSDNRFMDPEKRKKIEEEGLKFDAWALKSAENLRQHRALFKEKIAYLRKAGPKAHVAAVRAWWDEQLKKVGYLV